MRECLRGLTTRGRAFLAAGVTAFVCALVLGHDELVRVGALLVLLPLVTAFFLSRGRYGLGLVRSLSPGRVPAGAPARVELELTNEGPVPSGTLQLEDHLPYALGNRPRFTVERMGARWHRTVDYQVSSDVRGRFTLGPMTVRQSDPFGLVELDRTFASTTTLVVTPRVVDLPPIALTGAWTGSGDRRPRAFAGGSAEDVTVREYRRGDDLRRVHWRSSAHAGELMVRREEQPWQSRATVFLDNRTFAHRGGGAASSFEQAVSAAASVAVHLAQRGFSVRLVTASGEQHGSTWYEHASRAENSAPLLESLAVVDLADRESIDARWLAEHGSSALLVAVFGELLDRDAPVLARMRHSASSALAVSLDVRRWVRGAASTTGARPAADSLLIGSGWRAAGAGPSDQLSAVWRALASDDQSSPLVGTDSPLLGDLTPDGVTTGAEQTARAVAVGRSCPAEETTA